MSAPSDRPIGGDSPKANGSDPPPEPSRGGVFSLLVWSLFLILVVYPLSIGPAVWLHRRVRSARPAIEAAYLPITFLSDHCKPIGDALEWYVVHVWQVPD